MDVLFGMVGDGFVLLVSDTSRVQSIVVQRTAVDKIVQLDSHKLMARACTRRSR
jgi:20S proteasome subunit beta 4